MWYYIDRPIKYDLMHSYYNLIREFLDTSTKSIADVASYLMVWT